MTTQSDLKKLAEQMAGSMKSFDDIKDFQKQLMQSFIDTALEAEMEDHLGYPKHEKADKPNKRNGHTKKTVRSDTGDLEISTPRDRDGMALLNLHSCVSIKPVSQVSMTKSYHHYRHSLPSYASGRCAPHTCLSSLIRQGSNHHRDCREH